MLFYNSSVQGSISMNSVKGAVLNEEAKQKHKGLLFVRKFFPNPGGEAIIEVRKVGT